MHIPDNYLSVSTCAVMASAMLPIWAVAIKKVKTEISSTKIPMLGVCAAFSFLIMMFNVPLPGGTTGHAIGGTLLAVLLGNWAALIAMTVALLIQALLFGDGGILAFGANCFNIAFVAPFVGYFIYRFIRQRTSSEKGEYIGLSIASYIGVNMAALCAAIEFGVQPILFKNSVGLPLYCPYPLSISIAAMAIPHLLVIGFVEAVFTVGIYAFIKRVSPAMIYNSAKQKFKWVYSLIILLICLSPIGLMATGNAWGEWGINEINSVITNGRVLGFIPDGMANGFNLTALMQHYSIRGLSDTMAYILSAIVGVSISLMIFKIISITKKNNIESV